MRVKEGHPTTFRIKKAPRARARIILPVLYVALLGVYLYHGFQPFSVDASGPIRLSANSINLSTPVDNVEKTGSKIAVPEHIAGAYSESTNKTLLIGHSNTVFDRLGDLKLGDTITFDHTPYQITRIVTEAKANIDMSALLAPEDTPTIVLMTCTGTFVKGHDYTHRLIVTATSLNSR